MMIYGDQKKQDIRSYFELLRKFNQLKINNVDEVKTKLIELNEKINSILLEAEKTRSSLSVLSAYIPSKPKDNIINVFIYGLISDVKTLWKIIIYSLTRFISKKFGLREFLNYFLVSIFLVFIGFLAFTLKLEYVIFCFLILLICYVFITVENSHTWSKNQAERGNEDQKKKYKQRIDELKSEYEQIQETLFSLQPFLNEKTFDQARVLERKIIKYLEEDIEILIQRGMQALNLKSYHDSRTTYQATKLLERRPIISFVGKRSSGIKQSSVIIEDRELQQVEKKEGELYISDEDFYEEKGIDGKNRYGVYEFVAIFLCDNFLSYYRCYWNFLKQIVVDEEICEYLYDSIVSIKTQDKSSSRLKDQNTKRTYRYLLSVTTMDGNILYIKLSQDRKEKVVSISQNRYVSDIDSAAELIRYWIRQRRVDYFRTEDRNQ